MVNNWALVVAVLAFMVSAAALVIAWWQLVLQRDAAGGRGMIFDVRSTHRTVARQGGVETITDEYRVYVKLVGNDRHEVAVHLERNGRQLEPGEPGYPDSLPVVHRMTSESDPIDWRFNLTPGNASDVWCVLSWGEPFGDGIRTAAFRQPLTERALEHWRWFRTYRARRRIQSWGSRRRWQWLRRWLGKPRRLGAWRPYLSRDLEPGQSPMHSQFAIDGDLD